MRLLRAALICRTFSGQKHRLDPTDASLHSERWHHAGWPLRRRRLFVGLIAVAAYGALVQQALAAPTNVMLPAVSGGFQVGSTLVATSGDWLGTEPISYAYQWQSCASYKTTVLGDTPVAFWRLGEASGTASAA